MNECWFRKMGDVARLIIGEGSKGVKNGYVIMLEIEEI